MIQTPLRHLEIEVFEKLSEHMDPEAYFSLSQHLHAGAIERPILYRIDVGPDQAERLEFSRHNNTNTTNNTWSQQTSLDFNFQCCRGSHFCASRGRTT
mmetsp:Transcript_14780/g.28449  ORF Transcript_14780/g.28449 Transcript_14780/m.28449 type:complete len:98 (-) Transcript_14780:265-558(-)